MPSRQHLALFCGLLAVCRVGFGADLEEIVHRAAAVIQSDWAADPDYAYVERDETLKNGKMTSRTFQVVMIDGSDYNVPAALDDQPFSVERQKAELQKLKNEVQRRKGEDPAARQRRIADYRKREDENGSLLLEFPKAFNFELTPEEQMNGFPAYVLSASPKKRAGPLGRAAKVLSGMTGTVWIDSDSFHAIRGDCTVLAPVPIFGIMARVLPGTHVDLELAPVSDKVWLISKFSLTLMVSKFLLFNSMQVTSNTYTGYRPNGVVLEELLARADAP